MILMWRMASRSTLSATPISPITRCRPTWRRRTRRRPATRGASRPHMWPRLGRQRVLRYTYDGLQRLIGANERPGSVYTYTYDLAGNRTSVQLNGGIPATTTYNNANQITNASFSYDLAGNLTHDDTVAYTYDALNRTTQRGTTTTYTYNGDGTLVKQIGGFCITPQKGAVGLKPLFCSPICEQKSETSTDQMAQNV